MRALEKIALIDQIGRALQEKFSFSEINAYFSEYRIPIPKDVPTNSKWVYSKSALQGVSTDVLEKIAQDVGVNFPKNLDNSKVYVGNTKNRTKPYYSVRSGKNPLSSGIDFNGMLDLFYSYYKYFELEGFFQEYMGYYCIDAGFISGKIGHDVAAAILIEVRKRNMTPIDIKYIHYSEDDLFDMIEFLYEHCSKPINRIYHDYNDCGWHCETFDREAGRLEFREKMNKILSLYDKGYELSAEGEILTLADFGLHGLFEALLPNVDPDNVTARVSAAQLKFRRSRSSIEDRRDAIRDLVDVLEYLRPKLKNALTKKDEADLFEIANRFGVRHHDDKQKNEYDKPIFYSWMFYYYLGSRLNQSQYATMVAIISDDI